ncbi:MAG: DUF2807 domain-containing protein [Bacteroidales bacterium]|nr:DUF2807 domain-containing protein [Bacteroidales bacterium]
MRQVLTHIRQGFASAWHHGFFFALLSCTLLVSCEKDHLFDFLKSTGKDVTITRDVPEYFTQVRIENNINAVFTQGSGYSIRLEGGENLLPGIDTEIKDSLLTIRNNNRFNWVRAYDRKITAYITAPHFLKIGYEGTGTLTNTDTIREDSIFITAYAGSGYLNFCLDVGLSHLVMTSGSADFNISGHSGSNFIFAGSYGPFHCQELETFNTYMSNKGTNDCYIYVKNHLEYDISGLGNIYCKGNPSSIIGGSTSEGKLILQP